MLCRNGRRTATSPGVVPRLNQTTHGHSSLAATSGRNPDQKSVEEILAKMRQHYLPGVIDRRCYLLGSRRALNPVAVPRQLFSHSLL
jgi:hypothetical protein